MRQKLDHSRRTDQIAGKETMIRKSVTASYSAPQLKKLAKRLIPQLTAICNNWRNLWKAHIDKMDDHTSRRAALWVGHSTLRHIILDLAADHADHELEEIRQGTSLLWELGIGTDDLSHMVTLYEEVINRALQTMISDPQSLLKAAGCFDGYFHAAFACIFHTYSSLDRTRQQRPSGLTRREEHILLRIGKGETSRIIGKALNISARTVDAVRERLKTKLACKNSSELVRHAIRLSSSSTTLS